MDALRVVGFVGLVLGLFYGALCLFGLAFMEGDHTEAYVVSGNCVEIVQQHTNWYPSPDKVLSSELWCDGSRVDR